MSSQPHYLGPEYSNLFKDSSLVEAYRLRPPYPAEIFEMLTGLITDEPRAVLDVGCGTGNIARPLVCLAERVDAVDFSFPMIEKGRSLSRQHMTADRASTFDDEVRELASRFYPANKIEMRVVGTIVWGRPESGKKTGENV